MSDEKIECVWTLKAANLQLWKNYDALMVIFWSGL